MSFSLRLFALAIAWGAAAFTCAEGEASASPPPAETSSGWVKYGDNPVFGGAELGTCFDLSMLQEDGLFKMWFSWRPKHAIGYTESADGVHWKEPQIVLAPDSRYPWESEDLNRPAILKKDGVYHLWFTAQAGGRSVISYATSPDGVNFSRRSEKPVLIPETSWEKVAVMCPHVEWDSEAKLFRMWYSGGEQYEPDAIGYATSTDGVAWTKYAANPIFAADPSRLWENHKVTACQVLHHGDWWYMFYIGFENDNLARIGMARSRDGVTGWQRHAGNPIAGPGPGKWDSIAVYKPFVIFDPAADLWRLWYNGRNQDFERIGLVTHPGEDLGFVEDVATNPSADSAGAILRTEDFRHYIESFNATDNELYRQAFPNTAAWDFLSRNVPFFECPDKDLEKTWYFRWWTLRKHLKKTAAGSYVFTEFLPAVPWAGKENTISCAAGHHFREARWLRDPRYLNDYARFWFEEGASPRQYSFWAADSLMQQARVTGDDSLARSLLPALRENHAAWEREHRDPNGLLWQSGNRDGMEVSAAEAEFGTDAQYRSTLNSDVAADALALAELTTRTGDAAAAAGYRADAARLISLRDEKLWDTAAAFYKVAPREASPGQPLRLAHARELHGYTPWYFDNTLPPAGHDLAWAQLADPQGFAAPFGPTTTEQRDPGFRLSYQGHECQWNGPSWPYATSITLTALANLIEQRDAASLRETWLKTFTGYVRSQRLRLDNGTEVPWIDENLNPATGDWISRTRLKTWENGAWSVAKGGVERGKDYNHSTFGDLVITGIAGLRPAEGSRFVVNPLAPASWDYFCLDRIPYHGKTLTILYDRSGTKYLKGTGLMVFADGQKIASSPTLGRLACDLAAPAK
ncbi:MAG: hypothetical protein JWO82_1782 [Akkermansiaceae bacterium]|nr:hypothetical protein [Akkermansiaceae bacterium]